VCAPGSALRVGDATGRWRCPEAPLALALP